MAEKVTVYVVPGAPFVRVAVPVQGADGGVNVAPPGATLHAQVMAPAAFAVEGVKVNVVARTPEATDGDRPALSVWVIVRSLVAVAEAGVGEDASVTVRRTV